MQIEQAVMEDLPEILAVQKVAFYQVAKFYRNFRLAPLLTTIEDLEKNFSKYFYIKALINQHIVGSAKASLIHESCLIEGVSVHPDYQKKGIGKAMIQAIESNFSTTPKFKLWTGKNTGHNVDFYKNLGYQITGEEPASAHLPPVVLMEKNIHTPPPN